MNTRKTLLILAAVALSGCESMSVSECKIADWGRVGFADGAAGVSEDRLAAYTEDCGKAGVQTNPQAYRQGWDAGIQRFCTAASGWHEGVQGHSGKAAVCQGRDGYPEFSRYLDAGLQLYRSTERLRQNSLETERLQKRLEEPGTDQDKRRIRDRLRDIDRDQYSLRNLIAQQQLLKP